MGERWTAEQIPDQSGRVAVVTGANGGLGLITARELARAGAHVVLACRNTAKGETALREVERAGSAGSASVEALDLADLASVRAFAERFQAAHDGLDLLINNAGLMAPPRSQTRDGFELQLGTNHLGHFALTGLLLDAMEGREDARVVTVSSNAHKFGKMSFDDLQGERRYRRWRAYGQSKLANLLFMFELERRLTAVGSTVKSLGAHPGYAKTNLQQAAPPRIDRAVMAISDRLIAQGPEMGALPQLYAATHPDLQGSVYVGPGGRGEHRGHPQPVVPKETARDEAAARRLWEISEQLTGVRFEFGGAGLAPG